MAHHRAVRRAAYGPDRVADARTWFSWQWLCALAVLCVLAVLPVSVGDGPAAETVWLGGVAGGVLIWAFWVARLNPAQAPARGAAAEHAVWTRQVTHQATAQRAAEQAAYLAPRQHGNVWRHGQCSVNHRTHDTAQRCRRG